MARGGGVAALARCAMICARVRVSVHLPSLSLPFLLLYHHERMRQMARRYCLCAICALYMLLMMPQRHARYAPRARMQHDAAARSAPRYARA